MFYYNYNYYGFFKDGRLVPREEAELYGPNPPGTLYFNNIECPDYIEEYQEDCSLNFTYYCDYEVYVMECFDYQGKNHLLLLKNNNNRCIHCTCFYSVWRIIVIIPFLSYQFVLKVILD